MKGLSLATPGERLNVLCLGAHSDDIEIGAGGALLEWIARGVKVEATWCVFSAPGQRGEEAETSARSFLQGAASARIELQQFRDGYFPVEREPIKEWMQDLSRRFTPDVVLTHKSDDAHQDHRLVSELTWNAFRDQVVLEYEIPKWDGDLGRPNVYVPLTAATLAKKLELLELHFATQHGKDWFDPETFQGLARLRGMECRAPERYAEGFVARKILLA
ncbi:PIG-L deacetylase family protein [Neoroseomonas oryzicola]|uniref:PIG-L family deacetylase n=1 Tax=Neoroseomonas oryzicola TaxID=535904 RepID=A0A9X9WHS4_9PROT|nr:PIG-L deacetylase family protein [Neoroseomonas oryzicola]MBR0659884.1 PIG-L family deacetylase [Neoroseomonas oryzicola]NKE15676.1 PIG-L family deacetylase [Neoroseomonas oryzicola]